MVKLWIVMTEAFGYRWFKPMGEEPNQTWSQGLRNLTPTQWRNGLGMLSQCTEEWPPSLPEFRRWCTGRMTKEQLRAYAQEEADRVLGKKYGKYNPHVTPPSYEQLERERTRLERQVFAQVEENERRESLGLEQLTDPERICHDEDYR